MMKVAWVRTPLLTEFYFLSRNIKQQTTKMLEESPGGVALSRLPFDKIGELSIGDILNNVPRFVVSMLHSSRAVMVNSS